MPSEFREDQVGIAELFSTRGDVGKYMQGIGKQITFLAKRYVGKQTHRLEQSIGWRTYDTGGGTVLEVTASNRVAYMHHQGTRPHLIAARPGRTLRFKSRGMVVYARVVRHPGTRPNPYLVTALREVVRQ